VLLPLPLLPPPCDPLAPPSPPLMTSALLQLTKEAATTARPTKAKLIVVAWPPIGRNVVALLMSRYLTLLGERTL